MKTLLTIVCLLALTIPVAAEQDNPLDQAMKVFGEGKYAEVVELCEKIGKDSDDYARAQYLTGESYLQLGEPDMAVDAFRAVLEKKPEAVPALIGLGAALSRQGKHDEAIAILEKVVAADKKDAEAKRALGEALVATERTAEAQKVLTAAWKLDKKNPYITRALVNVLLILDAAKEAQSVAAKLAKSNSKHPMGHFLMALCLEKQKQDDAAIVAYERAIKLDDRFLDAHKNLAILCMTVNPSYTNKVRTEKALKHFEKYFDLGGEDAELRKLYNQLKGFMEYQKKGR